MRISDWSSDVCSSDLLCQRHAGPRPPLASAVTRRCLGLDAPAAQRLGKRLAKSKQILAAWVEPLAVQSLGLDGQMHVRSRRVRMERHEIIVIIADHALGGFAHGLLHSRSEEHTSELQSLMRNSYSVFCLQKNTRP